MKNKKPLQDIAAELGVSPAAVSFVLNNKKGVSDATRTKITDVLESYGYKIKNNTAERRDVSGRPLRSIRFLKYRNSAVSAEENGNFVSSIMDSLEEECRKLGFNLIITTFDPENRTEIYSKVSAEPMDGIVVLGTELEAAELPFFETLSVPVVLVDTPAPSQSLNCVALNNEEIIQKAIEYFYQLGHREIGYLHSSMDTGNFHVRMHSYRNTMNRLGLTLNEEQIYPLTPSMSGSYEEICRLLEKGAPFPAALLADNDMIALGCSRALKDKGFRLPHAYSMIGIGDIAFSSICVPPLTSIRIPCKELGILAAQLLYYKLSHPDTMPTRVLLSGELVVRSSVAAVI